MCQHQVPRHCAGHKRLRCVGGEVYYGVCGGRGVLRDVWGEWVLWCGWDDGCSGVVGRGVLWCGGDDGCYGVLGTMGVMVWWGRRVLWCDGDEGCYGVVGTTGVMVWWG